MAKKVELLAPAGNYEGLVGAIGAGADAVYLGGSQFGARAYAENFDAESLLKGIHFAHLHERKVYLTVNTLVKEKEFGMLYDYLKPLYEAGLDGAIVQDIGVLCLIREQFPQLPIHASTQMNITHTYGAEFLKKCGVSRVVPARELSLHELHHIHKQTDIELETFIHGAMCYSYSGQCLFSSILGGRSGNRGRCAQPCRLPYHIATVQKKHDYPLNRKTKKCDWYPLSMKDMCTIELLPELIRAGIHSFKIEGRMKKPEYTAGVTSIYIKYIDLFYTEGAEGFAVSDEDKAFLQSLYIRSETGDGYYHRHNGKEMITPHNPGYAGSDEDLLKEIRRKHIESPQNIQVKGEAHFTVSEPAKLILSCREKTVCVNGTIVEPAQNMPLTEETINRQLRKSGNTIFTFEDLQLTLTGHGFMMVKEINELRRKAFQQLEETLLEPFKRTSSLPAEKISPPKDAIFTNQNKTNHPVQQLHLSINTPEQWKAATMFPVKRIYINIDLWTEENPLPAKPNDQEWFVTLPRIIRLKDDRHLPHYQKLIESSLCDGILIQNLESYEWLQQIKYSGTIVTDSSLYIWNTKTCNFWQEKVAEYYLPIELNKPELQHILANFHLTGQRPQQPNSENITGNPPEANCSLQIYGRIPMMISANCISKTQGQCHPDKQNKSHNSVKKQPVIYDFLQDRYGKQFPVWKNCRHCYNIIYNSIPLSLHDALRKDKLPNFDHLRLDFTTESEEEMMTIISFFNTIFNTLPARADDIIPPYSEYTTGHFKRGAE